VATEVGEPDRVPVLVDDAVELGCDRSLSEHGRSLRGTAGAPDDAGSLPCYTLGEYQRRVVEWARSGE